MVSAASVFPGGVAAEKRLPQAVEAPPVELTHGARMSASVLILLSGTVPLPAGVLVSASPVAILTIFGTWAKAFDNPATLVPDVPIWIAFVMNGRSAHTEATVVTSSMTMDGYVEIKELHVPNAAISASAELLVPLASPGFPPSARMYTWSVPFAQLQPSVILKLPLLPVVTYPFLLPSMLTPLIEVFNREVEAEPYPIEPAAYR